MTRLTGVIAAVTTPFDDRLGVDLDRLTARCSHLLASGCDGINLLGTTGEATSLTVAQRIFVMEGVAGARLPLDRFMVGTGAAAFGDAMELTRRAQTLGFGGALLLPPFYYKGISETGLCDYVERVAAASVASDLPLYLYNFPQLSGVPYTLAVVRRLQSRLGERLAGLKDSSGDISYSAAITAETGIDVFPSSEAALGMIEEHGFAGCISATANVTYALCAKGLRAPEAADRSGAIRQAVEIREALASAPTVPAVKWAVAEVTGDPVWARVAPPLSLLARETVAGLRQALAATRLGVPLPSADQPQPTG